MNGKMSRMNGIWTMQIFLRAAGQKQGKIGGSYIYTAKSFHELKEKLARVGWIE